MAKVITDDRYYYEIADAIRQGTGTSTTYLPEEMGAAVTKAIADASSTGGGGGGSDNLIVVDDVSSLPDPSSVAEGTYAVID